MFKNLISPAIVKPLSAQKAVRSFSSAAILRRKFLYPFMLLVPRSKYMYNNTMIFPSLPLQRRLQLVLQEATLTSSPRPGARSALSH